MNNPFEDGVKDAFNRLGHATILLVGRSGVGKSTLINVVFSGDLAETGQGRPVTKTAREYRKPPISLIDSRGLELSNYHDTLDDLRELVDLRRRSPDPNAHIHCAWICITEGSSRVEEAETKLAEMLDSHGVPVVGVVTKHVADNGFRAKVEELIPCARAVVSVRALESTLDDHPSIRLPPKGLDRLVEITIDLVPDGHRGAIAAAQKVSIKAKQQRARAIVATGAASAAAAAAIPIPGSDVFTLVPIQVTMLATISIAFGLDVTSSVLATIVAGAVGASGAAIAGRALAGFLVKLIPGGSLVNATVAAALTTSLGEAYIRALSRLVAVCEPADITSEMVAEAFKQSLRSMKPLDDSEPENN